MKNQTKKISAPAEIYTSPTLERFMARANPARQRRTEQLMELGDRIYDAIVAKYGDRHGVLKTFAEAMGRKQSEVSKWISGRHNFTVDLLFTIQEHLGIELLVTTPAQPSKEVVKYVAVMVSAAAPAHKMALPQPEMQTKDWPNDQSFVLKSGQIVSICKKNKISDIPSGALYGF